MPDVPIDGGSERDYHSEMEPRVRVLEEIAVATKAMLAEIKADQRADRADTTAGFAALRTEMTTGFAAFRTEMTTGFATMRAEMISMEQRRERDFRITFGAIITTTLGLAYLIARSAHWL
ncbi:MAG TPA: hypothetical protein VMQ99_03375 [Acetobacteraceae bacterium]|jgi:hypothetical protein|nr:hypothetical protein [Acetobacteraceae bacterium]